MFTSKSIQLSTSKLLLNRSFYTTVYRQKDMEMSLKRPLEDYDKKRDFRKTNEPRPSNDGTETNQYRFVVQEHHASALHFDFRLEHNVVLKSWSIPKGPSLNPRDKRLAIMVEDHPISYMNFEGKIPDGEYGAGEVRTWDHGTYKPLGDVDVSAGIEKGKLAFLLYGEKLNGEFCMIRSRFGSNQRANQWLLIKKKDKFANEAFVLQRVLDYDSRRDLSHPTKANRHCQSASISPTRAVKKH